MMLLVSVVREWLMVLTVKGDGLYNLSVQHYLPICANMLNLLGCFHAGQTKNGKSYIVEWNEKEGYIVRNYNGLSKFSSYIVQFVTCTNQFLAAGNEHLIKIWDMDNHEILAVIDADGGLPVGFSFYLIF